MCYLFEMTQYVCQCSHSTKRHRIHLSDWIGGLTVFLWGISILAMSWMDKQIVFMGHLLCIMYAVKCNRILYKYILTHIQTHAIHTPVYIHMTYHLTVSGGSNNIHTHACLHTYIHTYHQLCQETPFILGSRVTWCVKHVQSYGRKVTSINPVGEETVLGVPIIPDTELTNTGVRQWTSIHR